jgi:hypothetical protein
VSGRAARRLRAFAADPTLATAAAPAGPLGTFVHYARVGDSHFVVFVERSYPWPLSLLLERPLGSSLALAAVSLTVLLLCRRFRRCRPAV